MYFIEERLSCVKQMPYTYERRAQGTLHTEIWKQRYACEDRKPLERLFEQLDSSKYRIVSNTGDINT